jgi:hypothetical protein
MSCELEKWKRAKEEVKKEKGKEEVKVKYTDSPHIKEELL